MNVSNNANVMFRYNSEYVAVIDINVPIMIHCVHSNTNSVPIIPVLITVIIQSTILQYNNDDYYSNSNNVPNTDKYKDAPVANSFY